MLRVRDELLDALAFEEVVPLFVVTEEVRLFVVRLLLTVPSLEIFSLEEVFLVPMFSLLEVVDLALDPSLKDVLRLVSLLLRIEELLVSVLREEDSPPLPADICERVPEER